MDDEATDKVIWVDTSAMVVDFFTKRMSNEKMRSFMKFGILDLRATDEGILLKMKKQYSARSKRVDKALSWYFTCIATDELTHVIESYSRINVDVAT